MSWLDVQEEIAEQGTQDPGDDLQHWSSSWPAPVAQPFMCQCPRPCSQAARAASPVRRAASARPQPLSPKPFRKRPGRTLRSGQGRRSGLSPAASHSCTSRPSLRLPCYPTQMGLMAGSDAHARLTPLKGSFPCAVQPSLPCLAAAARTQCLLSSCALARAQLTPVLHLLCTSRHLLHK